MDEETTELTDLSPTAKDKDHENTADQTYPETEEEKGSSKAGTKDTQTTETLTIDSASPNPSDVGSQSSAMSGDVMANINTDLTQWQKLRKFVRLEIVQTTWFETVILIVILINCVFLALDNPTNDNQTLERLSTPF